MIIGPATGRNRRRQAWGCLVLAGLCALPSIAWADSAPSCDVDTSLAQVAFGTYDPLSALPLDATGTLSVVCDKNNVVVDVALSPGGSGAYLGRQMQAGAAMLAYNLYVDSARSIVFGNGAGGTQSGGGITAPIGGGEFRARIPVYGRIPAGLDAAVGRYADAILVTVTF